MTNAVTYAELIQPGDMDAAEALWISEQIRAHAERIWEFVGEAYERRAWAALGYGSWDAYAGRELDISNLRLPRGERTEVVMYLRQRGMSTRAIASATGLGYGTVHRELSGDPNGSPGRAVRTIIRK